MESFGALILALAICFFCLLLSTWRQLLRKGQMPPGPVPLPVIGNFLQINTSDMLCSLMKISEKYGPVYTIHLGPRRIVVLCGYDAVKEALVDQAEDFGGRGIQATFSQVLKDYGIAYSNGERVKHLRQFSIATLRNFGMGKRSIEERILEEIRFLLEALHNTKGAPFDPTYFLSRSVSNVICSITFGDRFDYEEKEFLCFLDMMLKSFCFVSTSWGQLYDMFSGVMQYLPGPHHEAFKHLKGLEEFVTRKAQDHEETLDPNNPRDYIDCFLVKMLKEKENPNSEFFLKNLVMTALTLVYAGTETTSTTLRSGLLVLLKHPEIKEKLQEEIDHIIGRNRAPKMEDMAQMPYMEAVIHEIQRFSDLLPLGVTRRVTRDTHFRGYIIPQGTEVYPLLGSVLKDPQHFARPEKFDPHHFLDENGRFKRTEAFIPFSLGKRSCFGESLARMELFLFFASILQRFDLKSPVPPEDIDISPMLVGFATIPHPYELCIIPR